MVSAVLWLRFMLWLRWIHGQLIGPSSVTRIRVQDSMYVMQISKEWKLELLPLVRHESELFPCSVAMLLYPCCFLFLVLTIAALLIVSIKEHHHHLNSTGYGPGQRQEAVQQKLVLLRRVVQEVLDCWTLLAKGHCSSSELIDAQCESFWFCQRVYFDCGDQIEVEGMTWQLGWLGRAIL